MTGTSNSPIVAAYRDRTAGSERLATEARQVFRPAGGARAPRNSQAEEEEVQLVRRVFTKPGPVGRLMPTGKRTQQQMVTHPIGPSFIIGLINFS